MDSAKRAEWLDLMAKHPAGIDPMKVFLPNARRKESAFHDDYVWTLKEAADEYYRKRSANLVILYSTVFNTVTADQRLHLVVPMALKEKGIFRKLAKTAAIISHDDDELAQATAAVWQRLRRITRDLHDFMPYVPEFKKLYEILYPYVRSQLDEEAITTASGRKSGAAAQ